MGKSAENGRTPRQHRPPNDRWLGTDRAKQARYDRGLIL